jgi:E3 ubiquitin-protein ligase DOA10
LRYFKKSLPGELGRCELCKVKFHFAPQYAENAPEHLSVPEVLLGLARRAVARWLPFLLRLSFCISLWLVVAPLLSAYLYLLWMKRNFSCIIERLQWSLLPADTVSGAVLAATILISFLSLMSFADFLRVEWQQQQRIDPLDPDAARRFRREVAEAVAEDVRRLREVDNGLLDRFNRERAQEQNQNELQEQGDSEGGRNLQDVAEEQQRLDDQQEGQRQEGRENRPDVRHEAPADYEHRDVQNNNDHNDDDGNNMDLFDVDGNNNDNDNNAAPGRPREENIEPDRNAEPEAQRNNDRRMERRVELNLNPDPVPPEDPAVLQDDQVVRRSDR